MKICKLWNKWIFSPKTKTLMPQGISLHIGINVLDPAHYDGWSGPLVACEADAEAMFQIASSKGFKAEKLLTQAATREAVTDRIKAAAATLKANDIFFLSYAGHGGQVVDITGDEADFADETWCLYNGQLLDDELHHFWSFFAEGVRVLVISDSCHSGTVTRDDEAKALTAENEEGVKFRFMPRERAASTYRTNRTFYDDVQKTLPNPPHEVKASVRLIAGCQDKQLALDGPFNGLFTSNLIRAWNEGKFKGSYADFHSQILRNMPSKQQPNHFFFGPLIDTYDKEGPFTV